MPQMKEQEIAPEKELNEMKLTKIPDVEFKITVIRMLKDLKGRMDDLSENLNKEMVSSKKDIETINRNQ